MWNYLEYVKTELTNSEQHIDTFSVLIIIRLGTPLMTRNIYKMKYGRKC